MCVRYLPLERPRLPLAEIYLQRDSTGWIIQMTNFKFKANDPI